jgi:predicted ATP-binding protein involved in virulence
MSSESAELDLGMRLDSITLKNFRCFESLTVDLHPNLTVLIAKNGAGKTTILDALRIAVWPYVKGFDLGSQTGKSATIQIDDVRLQIMKHGNMEPQLPSIVQASGSWPLYWGQVRTWQQWRESIKKATNTKSDSLAVDLLFRHAKTLQKKVRNAEPLGVDLPIICYLGTGRLWYEGRYTSNATDVTLDQSEYSRLSGYLNCLTQSSSFKQFKDWYGWISRSHFEERILAIDKKQDFEPESSLFAAAIHVVQQSINALVTEQTGWHDISYSAQYNQQLVLKHAEHGVLPLEFLSDGLRNMVAMVADIAFRCIKLNPHFGRDAATRTSGIVMIDEVDMFLHPQWQQTVIGSLRTAFPKIQFIVTTHSPQVLSTVSSECIRVLHEITNEDGERRMIATTPTEQTRGSASHEVLASVMGTHARPDLKETQQLTKYKALIQQDLHRSEDGLVLLQQLNEHFGSTHPLMKECDRLIRLVEFKRGLPQRGGSNA